MPEDKIKANKQSKHIAFSKHTSCCCLTGLLIPGKAFRGRKKPLTLADRLEVAELYIIGNNSSIKETAGINVVCKLRKHQAGSSPSPRAPAAGRRKQSACLEQPSPGSLPSPGLPAPSRCIQQPREIKRCSLMSPSLQTDLTFLSSLNQRN